ncbi:DUF3795 domain-containing protein [Eubacterium sp.]|uniref:DUF3795 domain-containing protein n=1 Tax=Eubacterium sp. TaxID=142586 RepID=UPI0026004DFB|nr:DUF3795 domain-containing protein [Eubacterium sp.]MCR5630102.1 DUF3795 domain-containing protein [Eubacterium sp.]
MSLDNFNRTDDLLSLCGLNCGLCGYRLQGGCNGCFKDSSCAAVCQMAPCSVRHGNLQYCFECPEYPCRLYDGFDSYDTLVLHRNQRRDMQKAKEIGMEAYHSEQREKKEILNQLLECYDDGSKAAFFCLAVNRVEVEVLQKIMTHLDEQCSDLSMSEKANMAAAMLHENKSSIN